jgi:hypothetical protein
MTAAELEIIVKAQTAQAQKNMAEMQSTLTNVEKTNQQVAQSNAKLQKSQEGVANSTQQMNKHLQGAAAAGRQFVAALALGQVIKFAVGVGEADLALERLSLQTGTSIERLAELRAGAASVGVPFEVLTQSIAGFNQRLTEGLANSTSNVSLALKGLGLSARDTQGNVKSFADFLPELSDRLATFKDGVQKAQVVSALLGEEAGPRMIPFIKGGSAALQERIDVLKKFGLTTTTSVQQSEEFQQSSLKLTLALQNVAREAINLAAQKPILELLNGLANALALLRGPALPGDADELGRLQRDLDGLQPRLKELTDIARETGDSWWKWLTFPSAEFDSLNERATLLATRIDILKQKIGTGLPDTRPGAPDLSKMNEAQQILQNQFAIFQATAAGQRTILDDLNMAFTSHADLVVQAQQRIAAAYSEGAQRQIQNANIVRQLNLQQEQQAIGVARTAAQTITAIWPKQKNAAIAAATINTGVAVTEALKLTFPLNFIQAGLVLAAGVAQINAIRSTSPSGGGSLPSLSGGGAIGDTGGATPAAPAEIPQDFGHTVNIVLQPGEMYSTEQVRLLMDRIGDEIKDGAKLVSTEIKPF